MPFHVKKFQKLLIINTIIILYTIYYYIYYSSSYTCQFFFFNPLKTLVYISCLVSFAAPKKRSTYALLEPWLGKTKKS